MSRRLRQAVVVLSAVLLCTGFAFAQQGPGLAGVVVLRGGRQLMGALRLVEFGVVPGASIGTLQPGYGAIRLSVDGQEAEVRGYDVRAIEAEWVDRSTPDAPLWEIARMTVLRADGTVLVGTPTWQIHCSTCSVVREDGVTERVNAVPLAQQDFSPDDLIARVVIVSASPPEGAEDVPAAPAVAGQPSPEGNDRSPEAGALPGTGGSVSPDDAALRDAAVERGEVVALRATVEDLKQTVEDLRALVAELWAKANPGVPLDPRLAPRAAEDDPMPPGGDANAAGTREGG